jgi:hypothetical protein
VRNLLAFLAAIVLIFVGLGAWRGWYGVTRQPADQGKAAFRLEIDTDRIGQDASQAVKSLSRNAEGAAEAKP